MKKYFSLGTLLITALVFSLVLLGCGSDPSDPGNGPGSGSDTSPPVLLSAIVYTASNKSLKLTFSEPVFINSAAASAADGGGSSSVDDKLGGLKIEGNSFTTAGGINNSGQIWAINLTAEVTASSSITISYNSEEGIIVDKAGNALLSFGNFPVFFTTDNTGSTLDRTPPTLTDAILIKESNDTPTDDFYLLLLFNEPVTCDSQDVKLTLTGAKIDFDSDDHEIGGATWKVKLKDVSESGNFTIAYTRSGPWDIRDYFGNYLAAFNARSIRNTLNDETDPYLISAVVLNSAPNKLILTFSEPVLVKESGGDGHGDGSHDIGWVFDVDGGNEILFSGEPPEGLGTAVWTVTLNGPLTAGMRAWIGYHHGGAETVDYAGNDLHEINGRPVANRVGLAPDTTAPTLLGAYMTNKGGDTGDQPWMIMVFSEPVIMAGGGDEDQGGWTITGNTFNMGPDGDEPQIDSDIWLIPLTTAINASSNVKISYDASKGAAYDLSGNKLAGFANTSVTNKFTDNTPPTITGATAKVGSKIMVIKFSEPVMWLDMGGDGGDGDGDGEGGGGFTFTGLMWADQPSGNGTDTWTIPLTDTVTAGMSASFSYDPDAPGAIAIMDFNANPLAAVTSQTVTIQP